MEPFNWSRFKVLSDWTKGVVDRSDMETTVSMLINHRLKYLIENVNNLL